jgi:hypothetical protein
MDVVRTLTIFLLTRIDKKLDFINNTFVVEFQFHPYIDQ